MLPSVKSLDFFKPTKRLKNDGDDDEESGPPMRKRTFANERNQFVIHVYVPLTDCEQLREISDDFGDISPEVKFEDEPHISLIRGHYAVQYHQIDPLMRQLAETIDAYERFSICLADVKLLCNEQKSRYFIAICDNTTTRDNDAKRADNKLEIDCRSRSMTSKRDLIRSIHDTLKQYRSEIIEIGEEAIDAFMYHTSVAWFLPEFYEIGSRICAQIAEHFTEKVVMMQIDRVRIKIGHRTKVVSLR